LSRLSFADTCFCFLKCSPTVAPDDSAFGASPAKYEKTSGQRFRPEGNAGLTANLQAGFPFSAPCPANTALRKMDLRRFKFSKTDRELLYKFIVQRKMARRPFDLSDSVKSDLTCETGRPVFPPADINLSSRRKNYAYPK
jgi:hypothetical protein